MLCFWFFFCIIKDSPAPISLRMWKQEEDKLLQQLGNNRPWVCSRFPPSKGIFPPAVSTELVWRETEEPVLDLPLQAEAPEKTLLPCHES